MAAQGKKKSEQNDVMDSILSGKTNGPADVARELDFLIYKSSGGDDSGNSIDSRPEDVNFWQASKENISVQVWEERAKIRVKVSPRNMGCVSMKRIASIAVDAILKELKKEE